MTLPIRRGSYMRNRSAIRKYIFVSLGIFVILMLILVKLPKDINNYAWRSAHLFNRSYTGLPPPIRRGGAVHLDQIPEVSVGYKAQGVVKQVIITNGQIPHLVNFSRAVLKPGQFVSTHFHSTKDEVFHCVRGTGVVYIRDDKFELVNGTTFHVAVKEEHKIENTSETEELILLYFGIDVE